MKAVEDVGRDALVDIVQSLQNWLYLDEVDQGDETVECWNPGKEWSPADVCEFMAGKLSEHKLVPEVLGDEPEPPPESGCRICGGLDH